MTEAEPLQQIHRTYVRYRGRKLSYFSGCDYFRLSSHPTVLEAMVEGAQKFGLNVAASRMTTGNHELYHELEGRIAEFFGAQKAALFSNGYTTNLAVAQALAGECSHALLDERAHGSLVDAAHLLRCSVIRFRHQSAHSLAEQLRKLGPRATPLVLTDGMFSHDGSTPPLKEYLAALPPKGFLLVDDAHAAGVLGASGKGSVEFHRVSRRNVIQTVTLSKAFGVYGGAVVGAAKIVHRIKSHSRLFVGNTPLPLPLVFAALKAIHILASDDSIRQRFWQNVTWTKSALRSAGMPLPDHPGPIVSFAFEGRDKMRFSQRLLERRIYPPFIRYPGGPASGYFRFAISSEHSAKQLRDLCAACTDML